MSNVTSTDRRVWLLSLGGTIAMTGDAGDGVRPTLTAADLAADLADLGDVVIETSSFRTVPGAHLTLDDLVALAAEVDRLAADGATGVVVTQGTDTIEETAFALDVLVTSSIPVVVTGAMRNPTTPGADGPANVAGAVVVASSGADLGGVVVAFGDEVHAARYVAKRHPTRLGAFESVSTGPLGAIVEGRYLPAMRPAHARVTIDAGDAADPVVPILTLGVGDDGLLLRAARDADGAVVEVMGGGHVSPLVLDDLRVLAAAVPTVVTTRTRGGDLLHATYGFEGSERDVRASGSLTAGPLDAVKARLALMIALRGGLDRAGIAAALASFSTDPRTAERSPS
jgi:L-asparaginase